MKKILKTVWKTSVNFRIISITLAAMLVLGSAGFVYLKFFHNKSSIPSGQTSDGNGSETVTAGPGNNASPETEQKDLNATPPNSMAFFLKQNGAKYLNTNLGPTGREVPPPVTGEVGTWDIPIPLINPLGSQSLYSDTRYYDDRGMRIQYIHNYTEFEKHLSGESWFLTVNEGSGLPVEFLKNYASKIGAEIFSTTYADRLIFSLKQPDAIWWCDARESNYGYELSVTKQIVHEVGKEYTLSGDQLAGMNGDEVAFCTESSGEKFQTVRIGLPSGKVRIYAKNEIDCDNADIRYRYDITLDSKISNTFILDNLPQASGLYDWYFSPNSNDMPSGLTFKLEESYDLPKVKEGKEPGSLLVKGVPFGSVYVQPQNFTLIDYREANQRDLYGERQDIEGSLTPEGDTLFVLPSGLWTIVNRAPYMNYGSIRTLLVPVSSEEQTVVNLPESLKSANARLNSMADNSELTGSIEISEAKDLINTAEISLSVSDPLDRDIHPTKESTTLFEGSSPVEITDIRRVVAPCSIALVIDSSGSMKNDMKATLEAAKTFLQGLPEGSSVKVIDFDTQVRVLNGETPAEAVKVLSGITSGGYTKLYDATLKGVETVTGKTRPAVVVFTDGRDSSMDKTGGGSVNSKSAVIEKIKNSKIPVYTIGFGKRLNAEQEANNAAVDGVPDIQCLLEFASAAGGQYYPAKDPSALPGVFAAISSKLGNNFVITYNRPKEHNISQTPFISMVVDNSGSMNKDPSEGEDCNFRMQKTISMFHDFIAKLPENVMMQFTTFQTPIMSPPLIIQQQTTTDKKANILKALGEMEAHGGTPIVEALRSAYENIIPVPSSRKVIVFLTDGGLLVDPEQQQQYNDILEEIKDKNITILFIGMGAHSKEQLFADAAKATGGDYVISEDIHEIQTKLSQLLSTLKETTPPETIPLSVSLKWDTAEGEVLNYAVADEVKFSLPQKAGPAIQPDMVRITTGQPYQRYNAAAGSVTGLGIVGTENIITNTIPLNKKLSNKAMMMTVKQAFYLSRFQGIDAEGYGKQFVALEVELENILSDKIPYQIPSLFKHFYLGVNQEGLYPASNATWLADNPLAVYGNPEITLKPGEKKTGALVFVVPNRQGISQLSLHFYDTGYGHIQLPLAGQLSDKWLEVEKLPASAPASLSDTFTMKATGAGIKPKIEQYPAGELASFRIMEAQFESKVQALLNLDPKERFWLKLDTHSGSLMSKMSDATSALPFGFLEPVMLGPASSNPVRMAFDLPTAMGNYQSSIYADLATGKAEIPVSSGEIYGAPKPVATVDGPGIKLTVNQLVVPKDGVQIKMPDGSINTQFRNTVILDVTITDMPGNEGTRIPDDFFYLVNKDYHAPSGNVTAGRVGIGGEASDKDLLKPERLTNRLVFGIDSSFGVFEGQSRRGIVIFPKLYDAIGNWTLQSPYMENLQVPISEGVFASPELVGYKAEVQIEHEFEDKLDAAVKASVERYAALQQETSSVVQISLNDEDGLENVLMPSLSTFGLQRLEQITSEEQVINTLQTLRCLPVNRDGGYLLSYGYAPEAVITQGWGEIGDMTNLALRLFSRLGYTPAPRALALTVAGKKTLSDFSGVDVDRERTVPMGISYRNAAGERKMLVIPFMMDLSELEGFVYYQTDNMDGYTKYNQQKAVIEVSVRYIPGAGNGSVAGTAGDISGSLGGGEGGATYEELLMLETEIPISDLSTDALDLCFMQKSGSGTANSYYALLSGPNGMVTGKTVLENPAQVLGVKVVVNRINGTSGPLEHYSTLSEGDSLAYFYQTIAINLPDLTEEAAAALDEQARKVHDAAKNPDPLSIAKWYGRNVLYQFISGNAMFDNQMVKEMGLVLGRVNQPRCLILTSHLDKADNMHTSMDLLQPWNQAFGGKEDAIKAYNLMEGFYLSSLEGEVLPGPNKISYLDLWTQAPSGTVIQTIPCLEYDRDEIYNQLQAKEKYPTLLLKAVKDNKKLILVPTEPTVFMGQQRWAWLEIDPETYQTLSVFDTGLRAGMTEFKLSMLPNEDDTVKWLKGIWVGTNVSVWTMCSSTLKYGDNYKAVLADAKKTAEQAAKAVSEFFELAESIQNKEFGFDIDLGGSHKIEFKISMSGIKGSLSQKMYSLSGGMQLAIDAYFKSIAPKPETPGPKK